MFEWDEADFYDDDPLVRFNAHQLAKGRPPIGHSFPPREAWEIREELLRERRKVTIRLPRGWHLIWRRGDGIVSLFGPEPHGLAYVVVRRRPITFNGKPIAGRLDFPRRKTNRSL